MKHTSHQISVDDAISHTYDDAQQGDVTRWQTQKLAERNKHADEGRFASPDTVKAVIAKFIPNG